MGPNYILDFSISGPRQSVELIDKKGSKFLVYFDQWGKLHIRKKDSLLMDGMTIQPESVNQISIQ